MPEIKRLIPRPDLVVRDPATMQPLPPEGLKKQLTGYWRRRLRDRDVIVAGTPWPEDWPEPAAPEPAPAAGQEGED
jgi:hypothetical protein